MLQILVDTPALDDPLGSGVKTYTLNLLKAHAVAGHKSHLLYETPWSGDPSLNELFAGQFAQSPAPSSLCYLAHKLRVRAGLPSPIRRIERRPGLILQARNRPEYNWLAQLPAWTSRHVYSLARHAHRSSKKFTNLENPGKGLDIWHAAFHRPLRLRRAKNIVTIHDLIPLRFPETNKQPKKDWYNLVKTSCLTADLILATSCHTKKDLLEFFNLSEDKVQVVYQAPEPPTPLSAQESQNVLETLDLSPGNYFLYVGNIEPRKNLRRIIQAWSKLGGKIPLVLAGHKSVLWEEELSRIPTTADIRILGYVSGEEKTALYQNAICLLFPSLYEGFGIPPLEAMVESLPVITSRNSSMPEICGDAALYVDPLDVSGMASAMQTLIQDKALRLSLIEKGIKQSSLFTLERFSKQLNSAYESVWGSSRRTNEK